MKAKLSLTLDSELVEFVDHEPGRTRSAKIEAIVRRYRQARRDSELRRELAAAPATDDEAAEDEAWRRIMEETAWRPSAAVTFGRSRFRPSRNRARR